MVTDPSGHKILNYLTKKIIFKKLLPIHQLKTIEKKLRGCICVNRETVRFLSQTCNFPRCS